VKNSKNFIIRNPHSLILDVFIPVEETAKMWNIDVSTLKDLVFVERDDGSILDPSSNHSNIKIVSDIINAAGNNIWHSIRSSFPDYYFGSIFLLHSHPYKTYMGDLLLKHGIELCEPHFHVLLYRYGLFHLPKTAGNHFYTNYMVWRESGIWGGGHPTFNESHAASSGINLIDENSLFKSSFSSNLAIVRNPFDWLASFYFTGAGKGWIGFREKINEDITFDTFIKGICKQDSIGKWLCSNIYPFDEGLTSPMFDNDGILRIGNLIFFERLSDGAKAFNIPVRRKEMLPEPESRDFRYLKFRNPSCRDDYKSLYTDEMIDMVFEKFKFDFSFLGYDFDGLTHEHSYIKIPNPVNYQDC